MSSQMPYSLPSSNKKDVVIDPATLMSHSISRMAVNNDNMSDEYMDFMELKNIDEKMKTICSEINHELRFASEVFRNEKDIDTRWRVFVTNHGTVTITSNAVQGRFFVDVFMFDTLKNIEEIFEKVISLIPVDFHVVEFNKVPRLK